MIKVLKVGTVKKVTCKHCASLLEYADTDVNALGRIECPVCGNLISVNEEVEIEDESINKDNVVEETPNMTENVNPIGFTSTKVTDEPESTENSEKKRVFHSSRKLFYLRNDVPEEVLLKHQDAAELALQLFKYDPKGFADASILYKEYLNVEKMMHCDNVLTIDAFRVYVSTYSRGTYDRYLDGFWGLVYCDNRYVDPKEMKMRWRHHKDTPKKAHVRSAHTRHYKDGSMTFVSSSVINSGHGYNKITC